MTLWMTAAEAVRSQIAVSLPGGRAPLGSWGGGLLAAEMRCPGPQFWGLGSRVPCIIWFSLMEAQGSPPHHGPHVSSLPGYLPGGSAASKLAIRDLQECKL